MNKPAKTKHPKRRLDPAQDTTYIGLYIPEDMKKWLLVTSGEKDITMSELVRRSVEFARLAKNAGL